MRLGAAVSCRTQTDLNSWRCAVPVGVERHSGCQETAGELTLNSVDVRGRGVEGACAPETRRRLLAVGTGPTTLLARSRGCSRRHTADCGISSIAPPDPSRRTAGNAAPGWRTYRRWACRLCPGCAVPGDAGKPNNASEQRLSSESVLCGRSVTVRVAPGAHEAPVGDPARTPTTRMIARVAATRLSGAPGSVAERPNASALKAEDGQPSGGSNPSASASIEQARPGRLADLAGLPSCWSQLWSQTKPSDDRAPWDVGYVSYG
jgi:hypothetical protein